MSLVKELDENIFQIEKQYFYGQPVGVYYIILDKQIIMFDLPTYSDELFHQLKTLSKDKEIISILSHGSCGISDGSIWQKKLGLKVYLHEGDTNHDWLRMKPDVYFKQDPNLNDDITIISTPGHSPGSVCLLHKPTKIIFTGDSIYYKDGRVFLDDNTNERKSGLKILLNYNFDRIFPFHYDPILTNTKTQIMEFINK